MAYAELEKRRRIMLDRWPIRDGYTAAQQAALLFAVKGKHNSMLALAPKQTLRKLCKDGLIASTGRITKSGEDLVKTWARKDRR